ncbi:MAG TPA: hypothetical protein DHU75_07800 [Rikenellaceae bacterium]|nr:hypothetical protein [Rikenellaceae bacterium]
MVNCQCEIVFWIENSNRIHKRCKYTQKRT